MKKVKTKSEEFKKNRLKEGDASKKLKSLAKIVISDEKHSKIKQLIDSVSTLENDSNLNSQLQQKLKFSIEHEINKEPFSNPLTKIESLDSSYLTSILNKKFQSKLKKRSKITAHQKSSEILNCINENQIVLIHGETGCGKTTQIPQIILNDLIKNKMGSTCKIICTQPYRSCAVEAAKRVANDRNENLDSLSSVGYQVRLEKALPRSTGSITYCTSGILLRQMGKNPFLSSVSHLIIDELQERDLSTDLLLTLIKDVIAIRKDLKLILISSTVFSKQFYKYFDKCPTVAIPGFHHNVEELYLEDIIMQFSNKTNVVTSNSYTPTNNKPELKMEFGKNTKKYSAEEVLALPRKKRSIKHINYEENQIETTSKYPKYVEDYLRDANSENLNLNLIFNLILNICRFESTGSHLVFLPSSTDINKLKSIIEESTTFPSSKFEIIPIYSAGMATRDYSKTVTNKLQKIYLATNIAETSLTLNGIVHVIDSGKVVVKYYDEVNDIETVKTEWISYKSAKQRKRTVGRTAPGFCYHLFSRSRGKTFNKFPKPELLRSKLEEVILLIKKLHLGNPKVFLSKCMNPPSTACIERAINTLKSSNLLDVEGNLTPLGFHLANLPVSLMAGKMIILGALFSCLDPILTIAATIDTNIFKVPVGREKDAREKKISLSNDWNSDHLLIYKLLKKYEMTKVDERNDFCYNYYLNMYALKNFEAIKQQLANCLFDMKFLVSADYKCEMSNKNSKNYNLIQAIVCAGLYPKIAFIKNYRSNKLKKLSVTCLEKDIVNIHPTSVNAMTSAFSSPSFVYRSLCNTDRCYIRDTTMVQPLQLLFFGDDFAIEEDGQFTSVVLQKTFRFSCTKNNALLINQVREKFDHLLGCKMINPGVVDWDKESYDLNILRASMELIGCNDSNDSSDEESE